jgi:CPA2 family monovalent cation:H+ antiporter-2
MPWDSHITSFELNAKSPFIGKTLAKIKLREIFGVNIVAIQRGDFMITVPGRENHLYPGDKISVIGTDEQLEKFKAHLESTTSVSPDDENQQNISLHHFAINKKSELLGKTIRSSEIRERSQGLVVGIERNGERILNPESDVVFEINDKVWIVGNETLIQGIIKKSEILTEDI